MAKLWLLAVVTKPLKFGMSLRGKEIKTLNGHNAVILSVSFSPRWQNPGFWQ
jgi:hypothetical protein